jgi:hypothetical protein
MINTLDRFTVREQKNLYCIECRDTQTHILNPHIPPPLSLDSDLRKLGWDRAGEVPRQVSFWDLPEKRVETEVISSHRDDNYKKPVSQAQVALFSANKTSQSANLDYRNELA